MTKEQIVEQISSSINSQHIKNITEKLQPLIDKFGLYFVANGLCAAIEENENFKGTDVVAKLYRLTDEIGSEVNDQQLINVVTMK